MRRLLSVVTPFLLVDSSEHIQICDVRSTTSHIVSQRAKISFSFPTAGKNIFAEEAAKEKGFCVPQNPSQSLAIALRFYVLGKCLDTSLRASSAL